MAHRLPASPRTLRSGRKLPLAQVGYTGSNADKHRLGLATAYGPGIPSRALPGVKFDLTYEDLYGSDFLADARRFETIILHFIFNGWADGERERVGAVADHFVFGTSQAHSAKAWRERLVATGARRIFAFGGPGEVAGDYLGDIPGYAKADTPFGAVYTADRA